MRIAVTGATGFIGSGLVSWLARTGHDVVPLARGGDGPRWDPASPTLDARGPLDAVVHLAAHPVAVRWTRGNRDRILHSRADGTENLCRALAAMEHPPAVAICMSATGFYGDTGDEQVDESASAGTGFLPAVVQAWEAASRPAQEAGIRVVHPRFGVVLHPSGGALAKMLPFFRMGLGGPVGTGQQFLPWIHYDDAMEAFCHLLQSDLEGPVNVVAPQQERFADFARALGTATHRPSRLRLPAPVLKVLYGQMGQETILEGQRVVPRRLAGDGFQWRHPGIEEALADLFKTRPVNRS